MEFRRIEALAHIAYFRNRWQYVLWMRWRVLLLAVMHTRIYSLGLSSIKLLKMNQLTVRNGSEKDCDCDIVMPFTRSFSKNNNQIFHRPIFISKIQSIRASPVSDSLNHSSCVLFRNVVRIFNNVINGFHIQKDENLNFEEKRKNFIYLFLVHSSGDIVLFYILFVIIVL